MKKLVVTILAFTYLMISTGIVVNYHYCMNRLASAQLYAGQSKQCGKCGMHMDKAHGCCHDEVKVYKLDDAQKMAAAIQFSLTSLAAPVVEPSVFLQTDFQNVPLPAHWYNHSPPLLSAQDSYLHNRVFRI